MINIKNKKINCFISLNNSSSLVKKLIDKNLHFFQIRNAHL